MAILGSRMTRSLLVGATGAYGIAQLAAMRAAGANLVGLVSLGRGGSSVEGLPVFDTTQQAVSATQADSCAIYIPARGFRDAVVEAADAGIKLAVAAAEFVPVHDAAWAFAYARERDMWIVGPNTLGITSPGKTLLGSISTGFTQPGHVGVVGRSGTLTLTVTRLLTAGGHGQSTVVHAGGDSLAGRNPHEYFDLFADDPETRVMVYLGEIGGYKEYELANRLPRYGKPLVALIVGRHSPQGKQMGHAGALIGNERETAAAKREALAQAGALIADNPEHLVELMNSIGAPALLGAERHA